MIQQESFVSIFCNGKQTLDPYNSINFEEKKNESSFKEPWASIEFRLVFENNGELIAIFKREVSFFSYANTVLLNSDWKPSAYALNQLYVVLDASD